MKLLLVNDIDTLKSTDNATKVELAVLDEEQQRIDLSQFTTIAVQIGSNGSLYSTETPSVNEEMNTFSFTLSSELPAGTYSIQVNLTTADNKLHIAPNAGTQRLLIEKSFNEVGETIPIVSIKSLLDDMAKTLVIAKDAKTVADEAKSQVIQAVEASENAVSQVEGAVASANQAMQSSTDAVAVANAAKSEAQTASAMSSEAMTQADSAKALSTQATTDATKAKTDASTALSTANSAKSTAESVESRFNELTEGNTNDEVIQARTDAENTTHATLKARLDHEATARKNADAQMLIDAKSYTDTKIGNVDLSALSTKDETATAVQGAKDYADAKDAVTLQNANDYTDSKVGNIDFSTLATKQENEANLRVAKDYTDGKVSNIDLTSYATKVEVNNAIGDTSALITNDKTIVGAINEVASNSSGSSAKVYGIKIDTTNSNPESALEYIDDAVGFTPARMNFTTDTFEYGSWQDKFPFNQIKPCLFKDGQVVGYLNPNNYSKFVNGTSADITSGNSGDVMVEFPKVYWKFETIGTDLYIRYSKEKVDEEYKCLAHMRGNLERDKTYISAFLGAVLSSKLRSLSDKTPTSEQTISQFRTLAQANGSVFDQMAYYQILMLQVLYIVMFKDRNSQTALGRGYVDGNMGATRTGQLNDKGLFYGETTGKKQMKFCGVEDFYGNLFYFVDGIFSDASRNILINNQSFNDTGDGYTSYGQGATANLGGYISAVQGGTETGFIVKGKSGSSTTYYSDMGNLTASCVAGFGGYGNNESYVGTFSLRLSYSASNSYVGARLMFC